MFCEKRAYNLTSVFIQLQFNGSLIARIGYFIRTSCLVPMITWKSLNLNFKVLNFSFILKKGRECNVCIRALMRVCMV